MLSRLILNGDDEVQEKMECLLIKEPVIVSMDEETVFAELDWDEDAVWGLLLASGYLKVTGKIEEGYRLEVVNNEVYKIFQKIVCGWFRF